MNTKLLRKEAEGTINEVKLNKRSRYIKYKDLHNDEQRRLQAYCMATFQQVTAHHRSLFDFESPKKLNIRINLDIFNIIRHLRLHGLQDIGIFRISGTSDQYIGLSNRLLRFEKIVLGDYDVKTLASALKRYIRNHLNCLVPCAVTTSLIFAYTSKDEFLKSHLLKLLPFAIAKEKREVIKAVRAVPIDR